MPGKLYSCGSSLLCLQQVYCVCLLGHKVRVYSFHVQELSSQAAILEEPSEHSKDAESLNWLSCRSWVTPWACLLPSPALSLLQEGWEGSSEDYSSLVWDEHQLWGSGKDFHTKVHCKFAGKVHFQLPLKKKKEKSENFGVINTSSRLVQADCLWVFSYLFKVVYSKHSFVYLVVFHSLHLFILFKYEPLCFPLLFPLITVEHLLST